MAPSPSLLPKPALPLPAENGPSPQAPDSPSPRWPDPSCRMATRGGARASKEADVVERRIGELACSKGRVICKALIGADPVADMLVDRLVFYMLDVWLDLQIVSMQKVGAILQPLEELLLLSFPLPSFIIKPVAEKEHGIAVSIAEKEHRIVVSIVEKHTILGVLSSNIVVMTKPFLKTILQGAATTCYLALHPAVKDMSGKYFVDCNEATLRPLQEIHS